MTRPDPMIACNRHTRDVADRLGLRTAVAEDGEVRIRCGPRASGAHATFGFPARGGTSGLCWAAWFPGSPRALHAAEGPLRDAGALDVEVLDGETVCYVADGPDFLRVLDASPRTRPQRVRVLSDDVRREATARLAALRADADNVAVRP